MGRWTGILFAWAVVETLAVCNPAAAQSVDNGAPPSVMPATCGGGNGPIDSSRALAPVGGGCYPVGILSLAAGGLAVLPLIDPEWAPVIDGSSPISSPVLVQGTVIDSHVSNTDFPSTHVSVDQNTEILLDPGDTSCLATGNVFGPENQPVPHLELEWETANYPTWAWAGNGDRIVALGRWIFDCGHPDPVPGACRGTGQPCVLDSDCLGGGSCEGVVWNYRSELHPPQAVAVIRTGRGAPMPRPGEGGAKPIPVTLADVFVSGAGGGAGDACVVTHIPIVNGDIEPVLAAPCFPLHEPLSLLTADAPALNSVDFAFDMPLPPARHGGIPIWRVEPHPTPTVAGPPVTADLDIAPVLDASPHLRVTVRMTEPVGGQLPTGLAATILAGWSRTSTPRLEHLRVTVGGVVIRNALKPIVPLIPTPPGWRVEASLNGEWQELADLEGVSGPGSYPVHNVYDQWLPRHGRLLVHAQGSSLGCQDTIRGQSLFTTLTQFGGNTTATGACITAAALDGGEVDAVFDGPNFGARTEPYEVVSQGGVGAVCSATTTQACATDAECPAGETCEGAYALRFRIDRVRDADAVDAELASSLER